MGRLLLVIFFFQLAVCTSVKLDFANVANQSEHTNVAEISENSLQEYDPFQKSLITSGKKNEDAFEDLKDNFQLRRRKRGIGSVLVMAGSLLLRTTSLGITVAAAVTEGCAFYPSICENKKIIERLDTEIKEKKRKFDSSYADNGRTFVDMKLASTNNAYILYYTNETIRAVEELDEIINRTVEALTLKDFPKFAKIAESIGNNISSEKYLEDIVGQLEYSLDSVNKMLSQTKQDQLIGLAIQYLVETLLNRFMRGYEQAFGQIAEDYFFQSQIQNMFNENDVGDQKRLTFLKRAKLVPKVFKRIGQNMKKYFKDRWRSLKKWKRIKSWKGFKGKFKHSIRKPLQKIKSVKNFMTKSTIRRTMIRKFQLSWSQKISTALGVIADSVSIGLTIHTWSKVSKDMEKARENYEEYKRNLDIEIEKVESEKIALDKSWHSTIESFREITASIRQLFSDLAKNADFNEVFGLPKLPVDFTSSYLPDNFKDINRGNIISKQTTVKDFLMNMNSGFEEIQEDLTAREILYESVRDQVDTSKSVSVMLNSLKDNYKYKIDRIRAYGNDLTEKDIVCTTAVIFAEKTEYDFYKLKPFRPTCKVNNSEFNIMQHESSDKRNRQIMTTVVQEKVQNVPEINIQQLLDLIKNAYMFSGNKGLQTFGNSIRERDVICSVASVFPKMQTFDYLPLEHFRPSCTAVNDVEFTRIKESAKTARQVTETIRPILNMCDQFSFCPCIPLIAKSNNVSQSSVIDAIKRLRPDQTNYCGTTGCSCVDLSQ